MSLFGKSSGEPFEKECDWYTDWWYKATGDIRSGGSSEDVCSSCEECDDYSGFCLPMKESSAPCYCNPGECKDKEGPCFDCNPDTGECEETCEGCISTCNRFFKCPCDPSGTTYEATGTFNPCSNYTTGCYEQTSEYIDTYCEFSHPCRDKEEKCLGECVTLKGTNSPPACPSGKSCKDNGFIRNEETGATTYFVTACEVKEDCGCAAPPGSPSYEACGNCEICVEGKCEPNPSCGSRVPGRYSVTWTETVSKIRTCKTCNGSWDNYSCKEDPAAYPGLINGPYVTSSRSYRTFSTDGIFSASGGATAEISWACGSSTENLGYEDIKAVNIVVQRRYAVYSGSRYTSGAVSSNRKYLYDVMCTFETGEYIQSAEYSVSNPASVEAQHTIVVSDVSSNLVEEYGPRPPLIEYEEDLPPFVDGLGTAVSVERLD